MVKEFDEKIHGRKTKNNSTRFLIKKQWFFSSFVDIAMKKFFRNFNEFLKSHRPFRQKIFFTFCPILLFSFLLHLHNIQSFSHQSCIILSFTRHNTRVLMGFVVPKNSEFESDLRRFCDENSVKTTRIFVEKFCWH